MTITPNRVINVDNTYGVVYSVYEGETVTFEFNVQNHPNFSPYMPGVGLTYARPSTNSISEYDIEPRGYLFDFQNLENGYVRWTYTFKDDNLDEGMETTRYYHVGNMAQVDFTLQVKDIGYEELPVSPPGMVTSPGDEGEDTADEGVEDTTSGGVDITSESEDEIPGSEQTSSQTDVNLGSNSTIRVNNFTNGEKLKVYEGDVVTFEYDTNGRGDWQTQAILYLNDGASLGKEDVVGDPLKLFNLQTIPEDGIVRWTYEFKSDDITEGTETARVYQDVQFTELPPVDFYIELADPADKPIDVEVKTDIYSVSTAQATKLSQALTWKEGSQTLANYIGNNSEISKTTTPYNSTAQIFAVQNEYQSDGDNYYVLDVNASAKDGYNINSYDISLEYDNSLFDVLDVGINGNFNLFNSASVDSQKGEVRVVGGSAKNLSEDIGGGTSDGNVFQLLLKAKHDSSHQSTDTEDVKFTTTVNSTDTVVTKGEAIKNAASKTYGDDKIYKFGHSFVDFDAQNTIAFATQRHIGTVDGEQKFTSLIREGAELTSLGHVSFENVGNISTEYSASINQTESKDIYDISFGSHTDADVIYSNEPPTDFNIANSSKNINYGEYDNYHLKLKVSDENTAGSIIDLSKTSITMMTERAGVTVSDSTNLGGKNLITYKSDINYDGRVSMMDLAYLNAGAARNNIPIEDVDINHDTVIDINDLQDLDRQWGESLHEKMSYSEVDKTFVGSNGSIALENIGITDQLKADNSDFIQQSKIESGEFIDTLANTGSANYLAMTSDEDYGKVYDASPSDASLDHNM